MKSSYAIAIVLLSAGFLAAQPTPIQPVVATSPMLGTQAKLLNAGDVRTKLGLTTSYAGVKKMSHLKVAVLDFGFEGCDPQKLLFPTGSRLIEHYDPEWVRKVAIGAPEFQKGFEPGNPHGRLMAQALWAVTGNSTDGPVFYLLNANGPTLFRRAVRYAIDEKVDIILFSAHFEGGGNNDGRGPINACVNEALKAGIIWVNAAGNHRGRVFNGTIQPATDGYLRFGPSKLPALRFTNRLDENTFTITLTWNDYREVEDAGTLKDLDLIVEDSKGVEVGRSALRQIAANATSGENDTKNPRERVTLPSLGQGTYRIRVKANSNNFKATDRLRILLSPTRGEPYPHPETGKLTDPVQFVDGSADEELYPPADNPRVITVGEVSDYSARGPTADRRVKPDLLLPGLPAKWSNGEIAGGTSYSAAYYAGMVAVLKASSPKMTGDDLMDWIRDLRTQSTPKAPAGKAYKPAPVSWRTPTPAELAAAIRK